MGKYNYMNLNQKMIKIRRKVPKLIRKRYSEDVTYDFVKQAGKLADEHTMILLCPKTTFALLGTGKAKLMDCQIHDDRSQEEDSLSYAEACIQMKGKIRFAGQTCIKNLDYRMKNGIMKEVHIL